jgi:hypothetical protein
VLRNPLPQCGPRIIGVPAINYAGWWVVRLEVATLNIMEVGLLPPNSLMDFLKENEPFSKVLDNNQVSFITKKKLLFIILLCGILKKYKIIHRTPREVFSA